MNFVFISPQFPTNYWNFCNRLQKNGVTTLGIGDTPYDALAPELKNSLTEYYKVDSLENYDEVFRAVAFFSFRYGKIDFLESNNEYWLSQDARLRTDFHITTGFQEEDIDRFKSKAVMKQYYQKAGVKTARFRFATGGEEDQAFIREVGYPVFAKPEVGVGANNTYRIGNESDLEFFYRDHPDEPYLLEEFIDGDLFSYDAITDSCCKPIFETMTVWPTSIAEVVNQKTQLSYYTTGRLPDGNLKEAGRRTAQAFGAKNRFVHLEFFRLRNKKEGLGDAGEYLGLEVNMRPAGGYSPDMFNYAGSLDVYQIWADGIAFDKTGQDMGKEKYFCAYSSQRDGRCYRHHDDEIVQRYGGKELMMAERVPDVLSAAMANQMYVARFATKEEALAFIDYVTEEGR